LLYEHIFSDNVCLFFYRLDNKVSEYIKQTSIVLFLPNSLLISNLHIFTKNKQTHITIFVIISSKSVFKITDYSE